MIPSEITQGIYGGISLGVSTETTDGIRQDSVLFHYVICWLVTQGFLSGIPSI